jgi:predicted helicase
MIISSRRSSLTNDLTSYLPRIPKVKDFRGFTDAGRLVMLHVGYEAVASYPLEETVTAAPGLAEKTLFASRWSSARARERSRTAAGSCSTATSAIEWIMERYQVKANKVSGIVNDQRMVRRSPIHPGSPQADREGQP